MKHGLVVAACALTLAGCGARLPPRPAGPDLPDPTAVDAFRQATRQCAGLQTLTAALRLSGRAGDERLRGTLHTGLAAPASLRVEAMAPFGQPFFILAGENNRATLLLPRDRRVLADAPVQEVLARLTGLALSAGDLRRMLSGCLADAGEPAAGRAFGGGWRAVTLQDEVTAYVRTVEGRPVIVAADHGRWHVDYAMHQGGWPRRVRIRSTTGDVDLTATIEQLEINAGIEPRAFDVRVPPDAVPMTLEHLQFIAGLRGTD